MSWSTFKTVLADRTKQSWSSIVPNVHEANTSVSCLYRCSSCSTRTMNQTRRVTYEISTTARSIAPSPSTPTRTLPTSIAYTATCSAARLQTCATEPLSSTGRSSRWDATEQLSPAETTSSLACHPHLCASTHDSERRFWSGEFLTGKYLYSASDGQPPRRGMDSSQRQALDDIIMQVMEMINANAKTRGRVIDFKEIQYGYRRVNPLYGAEYVLDLLLLYKKHKGKTMTVPVRRHAYLQQTFSQIQFREEEEMDARALASHINKESDSLSFLSNSLKMLVPFKLATSGQDQREPKEKKVNILVPLSGRYDIFVRFMANFERVCLIPNQNVKLLILLFSTDNNTERVKQVELMREYHMKYPRAEMEIKPVTGSFSRALALEVGSLHFSNDSLLFYCDVDLLFTSDFLKRCRVNTALGEQSYFPIIFSQYDPKVVYAGKVPSNNHYVFTSKTGLWRNYGFGIVCVYKGDLVKAGGFDTSIQGWGLEDVDLFNKFVQSGIKLFRSTDTGIVHVHHPVVCDPNLEAKQYKMCLGSKASSHGSTQQLAELWLEKNDLSFRRLASNNGSVRTVWRLTVL